MSRKTPPLSFHLSRRQLLSGAGATAGALAAGVILKGSLHMAKSLLSPASVKAATFYKGADISWAQQMVANSYFFENSNGQGAPSGSTQNQQITYLLDILKSYNVNAIRLRTWVNPSTDPVNGNCDQTQTIAMAQLAAAAGMAIDIDFHFGDTWNDEGSQNPPAAWANMTYTQMLGAMYNYVYGFCELLKYYKITPTWVQLGNEINSGICWPMGGVNNGAQMTGLLMAAYDMVKEVFPNTACIIHLAQPQSSASINTFFDAYTANGGKWDVTGFSSYGSAANAPGIVADMEAFQNQWGKPVLQVEFGGDVSNASGTATAASEYIQGVRNFGGLGVFYWEPEVYAPFSTYAMGAWKTDAEPDNTIMNAFASS